MSKYYITFGQIHTHSVNGKTFDKNCLCEITAESYGEAHTQAMDIFSKRFHNCHHERELERIIEYYPRGVIKLVND